MIIDMLVFILLNVYLLGKAGPLDEVFESLTFLKLLVFGLGVYRAANIVSNEFITTPVRAPFVMRLEQDGKELEEPYSEGFRGFVGSLLYCPSCTGVWLALAATYSYIFWPAQASIVLFLLALSGIERFFAYTFGRIKRK
jgi:hypothetical protein